MHYVGIGRAQMLDRRRDGSTLHPWAVQPRPVAHSMRKSGRRGFLFQREALATNSRWSRAGLGPIEVGHVVGSLQLAEALGEFGLFRFQLLTKHECYTFMKRPQVLPAKATPPSSEGNV